MKVNFNNGQVQSNNSGGYWDAEVVVAEIPKDDFAKYVVSKCAKGGKEYINLREWYHTRNDATWKPAKAGAAIPVPNGVAKGVITALMQAMQD